MSISLGVWLALYIVLAFLLGRLYATFVGWKFVRVAFFPGVVLAATGRLVACWVTGNDTKQCDAWRQAGPAESKGAPPGSVGFRLLFAIAPFGLALLGVLVADWGFEHPVRFSAELPKMTTNAGDAGSKFFDTCIDFTHGMYDAMRHQELGDARFWLFIWLAASFVVGSAPSTDDLKSVAVASASSIVLVFAMEFLGLGVSIHNKLAAPFWRGFSLLVAYTMFVLVASGVLFLPVKLLRDSRKEK
ncbi:MAG: hypothetical protein ACAI25_12620 [Planctomycetota bacterium]